MRTIEMTAKWTEQNCTLYVWNCVCPHRRRYYHCRFSLNVSNIIPAKKGKKTKKRKSLKIEKSTNINSTSPRQKPWIQQKRYFAKEPERVSGILFRCLFLHSRFIFVLCVLLAILENKQRDSFLFSTAIINLCVRCTIHFVHAILSEPCAYSAIAYGSTLHILHIKILIYDVSKMCWLCSCVVVEYAWIWSLLYCVLTIIAAKNTHTHTYTLN